MLISWAFIPVPGIKFYTFHVCGQSVLYAPGGFNTRTNSWQAKGLAIDQVAEMLIDW